MNIRNIALIGLFAGMLAACASPIQPDICATCCKQTGIQGATIVTVVVPMSASRIQELGIGYTTKELLLAVLIDQCLHYHAC